MKNNIIPLNPPLEKGEMVNALEKGEKFDVFNQANFSQEKILPSFRPFLNLSFFLSFSPFLKGG
ncbi:MAG: hypothetical protein JETT_3010 [Candidatus Jettenia ecosi]|uniref:Uncharacterized protein n=1 Tax=Candidatus Jettenia ecosi TaxID=2494326 RepID=A0A533Q7U7_9BACT|nr:MAG: hypothetical protein JETT_3010 [Candidatus Jettenia ecosi]